MAINFLSSIDISGTASISNISNDDSSYTGILVWDGSLLKYRTKAQLLSDIGGDVNNYVSSVSFNTGNGILSLARTGLATLTVDLDGRYALASGNVDGSGTTNFVAKWLDSNTIQDSVIFDNGTSVGIGTTTPSYKLSVNGDIQSDFLRSYQYPTTSFLDFDDDTTPGSNGTALVSVSSMKFIADSNNNATADAFSWIVDGLPGAGSTLMTLTDEGNLGIGTTNPSEKLDVNGSIILSSNATYVRMTDSAGAMPRVFGINASNTT